MNPELSVVICTHNPRPDYLRRTLAALETQTLPKEQWELLVIDNASKAPLNSTLNLDWHPQARCLREDELGLTPARLRGMKEARGKMLVFVDDDNILAADYLVNSKKIFASHPFLGAWGAGVIEPEFETEPPSWVREYFYLIALRHTTMDRWSNLTDTDITLPYGAGMCVRTEVATAHRLVIEKDAARRGLDRVGNQLGCAGDLDLALTSIDLGLGTGIFTNLKLTHIMPAGRTKEDYLLRLMEGNRYSGLTLDAKRGRPPKIQKVKGLRAVLGKLRRLILMSPRRRRFFEAQIRGGQRALRDIELSTQGSDDTR
jgi:glycosyltransferase involved in cell wall biosynthesis